jgi:DNA-binding NarL/FixJ family response regulator
MSSGLAQRVVQSIQMPPSDSAPRVKLSPREAEILNLLAKGRLEKQIAGELEISQHTVHAHIRSIYEKLQVHSHAQAVAKYSGVLQG